MPLCPTGRAVSMVAVQLALLAALVSGCKIKPAPTGEEIREEALTGVNIPPGWRAGAPFGGPVQDNWLVSFNDPQLDALVAEALARNPDLRAAAAQVERAAAHVELAKAYLRPWINLAATGGLRLAGGDLNSPLQGVLLGVSWEPDLWGRLRYARNAASESHVAAMADFEFGRQSLAATTAKGWFTATETRLHLRIAEDTVAAAQGQLAAAEKRLEVGVGSEEEVALARASLGSYRDAVAQLRLAHDQARRALELILGRYPAAELSIREELPSVPGPIPAGIPLEVLERRPDMIAAERRVAAAFNRVGEAKAAMLPRLVLNAGIAALESDILEFKNDYENPAVGAGAKLIAPIYQGGALKTQVTIRTTEQKEAVANYARTALQALGDVEGALDSARTLDERERVLGGVVADSERALSLVETSFRVGREDLRSVQEQQLKLYGSRTALLRVRSERLIQRVNLHLALGGSFEGAPPPAAADPAASARARDPAELALTGRAVDGAE